MASHGLTDRDLALLRNTFARHPAINEVVLFGSRAKGTAQPGSDIDLAVHGIVEDLGIAALADELDELPLPYKFDVKADAAITHPGLREHIKRVGVTIYERERATA